MKNRINNTIKATELRSKLEEVFDRVNEGQAIIVTHRFKQPLRLEPIFAPTKRGAELSGLEAFDRAIKRSSPYSPKVSLKKLYDKSMAKKYAV